MSTVGVILGAQPVVDIDRPPEPVGEAMVWYRGWEVGYNHLAGKWSPHGWEAYRGGCDLDAPRVTADNYQDCLDAVDEQEDC